MTALTVLFVLIAALALVWLHKERVERDGNWHRSGIDQMRRWRGRWEHRKMTEAEKIQDFDDRAW